MLLCHANWPIKITPRPPLRWFHHLFSRSGIAGASVQFCSVLLFGSTSQFLSPKKLTLVTVLSGWTSPCPCPGMLALVFSPSFWPFWDVTFTYTHLATPKSHPWPTCDGLWLEKNSHLVIETSEFSFAVMEDCWELRRRCVTKMCHFENIHI